MAQQEEEEEEGGVGDPQLGPAPQPAPATAAELRLLTRPSPSNLVVRLYTRVIGAQVDLKFNV